MADRRQTFSATLLPQPSPELTWVGLCCLTFGINASTFGVRGCWGISRRTVQGLRSSSCLSHVGLGGHMGWITLLSSLRHWGHSCRNTTLGPRGESARSHPSGILSLVSRLPGSQGLELTHPGRHWHRNVKAVYSFHQRPRSMTAKPGL